MKKTFFVILALMGSLKLSAQTDLTNVSTTIIQNSTTNPATQGTTLLTIWRYQGVEQGFLGYGSSNGNCYLFNNIGNVLLGATNSTGTVTFYTGLLERMRVDENGNVGIGTTTTHGNKLAVAGNILAEKVKVKLQANWPDYVFGPTYKLPSLQELEAYVRKHQHLPDVPSAKEVAEKGLDLGDTQAILLKKIEELTLIVIEQNKKLESQESRLKLLEKK